MKKFLALVLILAMCVIPVSAAETEELVLSGFSVTSNNADVLADKDNRVVITDANASDGSHSMLIKNFGAPFNEIIYYTANIKGADAGDYTFSIDISGAINTTLGTYFHILSGGESVSSHEGKWLYGYNDVTKTAVEGKTGWTRYSWDVSCTPTAVRLDIFENPNEVYFDNIKLVNKATGKDVMVNGSFEQFGALEEGEEEEEEVTFKPNDVEITANSAAVLADKDNRVVFTDTEASDGKYSMFIKNFGKPSNEILYYTFKTAGAPNGDYTFSIDIKGTINTALGVYFRIYGGSEQLASYEGKWLYGYPKVKKTALSDKPGWTRYSWDVSGAPTSVRLDVFENPNEVYFDNIKLVNKATGNNVVANGSFEEVEIPLAPDPYPDSDNTIADPTAPYGYALTFSGYANEAFKGDIYTVVNNKYYSKNHSLKVKNAGLMSDTQYNLSPKLEPNAPRGVYTYSFKILGDPYFKLGSIHVIKSGSTNLLRSDLKWTSANDLIKKVDAGKGWYEYKYTVDCSAMAPTEFIFNIYEAAGEFYFDNFSLTLNGDETKKNYIINGDFETIDETAPAEVSDVVVKNGNEKAVVTWKNPQEFNCVNVYLDGELYKTVKNTDAPTVTISELENDKTYNVTLKTTNNYNVESVGKTVAAKPYLPEYEVSEITLNDGDSTFVNGKNTIKATVKNNLLETLSANLIVALYNSGNLETILNDSAVGVAKNGEKELSLEVDIPTDYSKYSIKSFVWNGGFSPIAEPKAFAPDFSKLPKNVLTFEELQQVMHGYAAYTIDADGYIDAKRFSEEHEAFLKGQGVGAVTTIRNVLFDFETDSPVFYLDYKLSGTKIGEIDVFVDGVRQEATHISKLSDEGTFEYRLDGEKHKIHMSLPQSGLIFKNLAVPEGEEIVPIADRTKAVFYGDSITQGVGTSNVTYSYANIFGRMMNYDMINYGCSNYIFAPGQVIGNDVFVPDVVFVAYGTNDSNRYDEATKRSNITQFMANIKKVYPTQKIYVITPVYCEWNTMLPSMRTMIEDICKDLSNVTVIDGLDMIPKDQQYFSDTLHPNNAGAEVFAKSLFEAVK